MPTPKLLEKTELVRLDRYELIGEIASGGMATVFLARLAGVGGFQRFVAIKRLHPHLSNETDFVQMFLDEARLAASIHHPHVVPILEVGTSTAGYYVVMEYVEGDTLAGLMARQASQGKKLPAPVVLRIALDTLSGLHAAHDLRDEDNNLVNLVHRDVSPQNILVGTDGSARITDFGVAKASSRLTSTREGTLKGKLAYMPPEQAKGGAIDQRTDVFSLGVVLWEALAGRRLFKGETELETLNRLLFEPIPLLRTHDPQVPEVIEAVVMRALDRDPQKRFASAAEFADALERACQEAAPIATVRETASCVQQIIGHEIQQQRAAVRAWLAAEPSQQGMVEVDGPLAMRISKLPTSMRAGAGSLPLPLPPPSAVAPPVAAPVAPPSARAAMLPALNSSDVAALLDEVSASSSQVSSTGAGAMSVPEARASVASPPDSAYVVPPPSRLPRVLVPLGLFALLGLAFVGWSMRNDGASATTQPPASATAPEANAAASAPASAPVASASAAPSVTAASAATSIESLPPDRPTATVPGVGLRPLPAGTKKGAKPETTATAPATTTAAPTVPPPATTPPAAPTTPPDEGYKNPYR